MWNIWNWMKNEKDIMLQPSTECAYLSERWLSYDKKNLLDIGCGLGINSLYFALKGFNVTAVDISDYAIKYANDIAKQNGVHINTICGDVFNVNFEDGEYDCVFVRNIVGAQTKKELKELIEKITKSLRSGGELYITIPSKNSKEYQNMTAYKKAHNIFMNVEDIKKFFADYEIVNDIEEKIFYDKYCSVEKVHEDCKTYYFSLLLKKK